MNGARILLVEDDHEIRRAVAEGLRLDGHAVVEAESLAQARAARSPASDLVLLDVELPDGDGLELLAELRRAGAETPVLVLTARGREEDRVLGFEHGCDDYVVKPFSLKELRLRIGALLRRRPPAALEERRLVVGEAEVDLKAWVVRRSGRAVTLSPRERELLLWFLRHPGEVIARETFLAEVWGYERPPLTRTVDMHVRKLREKLERDPDHPRHFITIHGAGYRFDP